MPHIITKSGYGDMPVAGLLITISMAIGRCRHQLLRAVRLLGGVKQLASVITYS